MLTVTVTTQETTFALAKIAEFNLYGYIYRYMIQAEYPKFFIFETQQRRTFKTRSKVFINNLDIFAYINSKFVYIEKHIKTQMSILYINIVEQKCALAKQMLSNGLSLSSIAPNEMASRIMKTSGYTAITAEEVIHLIKHISVDCRIIQD